MGKWRTAPKAVIGTPWSKGNYVPTTVVRVSGENHPICELVAEELSERLVVFRISLSW